MKQYFINRNGTQEGPFSVEEIHSLNLSPDTPVMESDSSSNEWRPLSDVDEFQQEYSEEVEDEGFEDDYQHYVDNLYKYTFDLLSKKNYNVAEAFRDLVKQGVPVELAKTVVNNSSEEISKHNNDSASTNLVIGFVSFLIGAGVTAFSYDNASPGGTYIVAWGAMLFGVIQLFRGLFGFDRKEILDDDVSKYLYERALETINKKYSSDFMERFDGKYSVIDIIEKKLKGDDYLKPLRIKYSRDGGGENVFTLTENTISFILDKEVVTEEVKNRIQDLLKSFE